MSNSDLKVSTHTFHLLEGECENYTHTHTFAPWRSNIQSMLIFRFLQICTKHLAWGSLLSVTCLVTDNIWSLIWSLIDKHIKQTRAIYMIVFSRHCDADVFHSSDAWKRCFNTIAWSCLICLGQERPLHFILIATHPIHPLYTLTTNDLKWTRRMHT